MEFVQLTREVLQVLRAQGYNVLQSPMPASSADPTWYAEQVEDIWSYVDHLMCTPFQEPNLVVIDDVLSNTSYEELVGWIWLDTSILTKGQINLDPE